MPSSPSLLCYKLQGQVQRPRAATACRARPSDVAHSSWTTQVSSTRPSEQRGMDTRHPAPLLGPTGLTELWRGTVALWEALRRGEASGRGGHNVRGERWRRWGGSSSRRGRSIATCNTGHRGEGKGVAHEAPGRPGPPRGRPISDPVPSQLPTMRTYRLPVRLVPTFLNRKTERVVGARQLSPAPPDSTGCAGEKPFWKRTRGAWRPVALWAPGRDVPAPRKASEEPVADREHRRDPQSFSSTWVWGKSCRSRPASVGWGPGWGRGSQEKPVGSGGPGPSTEPTRRVGGTPTDQGLGGTGGTSGWAVRARGRPPAEPVGTRDNWFSRAVCSFAIKNFLKDDSVSPKRGRQVPLDADRPT